MFNNIWRVIGFCMYEERRVLLDVVMGVYHGAEVCKLVKTFLLEKFGEICNKSEIGLYRDAVYQFLETKLELN